MIEPFTSTGQYREAVLRLGEKVASLSTDPLNDELGQLCICEESEELHPGFGLLCRSLTLEPPEALCVALRLYLDTTAHPMLTGAALLDHYSRLGGKYPELALARLFTENAGDSVLMPIAVDFMLGRSPRLPEGVALSYPEEQNLLCAESLLEELGSLLEACALGETPMPLVVAVVGAEGSGRRSLTAQVCAGSGMGLLQVDCRAVNMSATKDILLASALYGAMPALIHPENEHFLAAVAEGAGLTFAICSEQPPECERYTVFSRKPPTLTIEARGALLREKLATIPRAPDFSPEAGSDLATPGRIERFALRLRAEHAATRMPLDANLYRRVLRESAAPDVPGAEKVECSGRLDDLALPPDLSQRLQELKAFIGARNRVCDSWGFAEKLPWGRGISVLFYGAPGTGKSLAAALLANEAGLPLMRVDISRLISKYIGETQKNLGRIFDAAQGGSCILFFDEADAVFARRTESSDAQDKYANSETAYLLQRMEQYDGICILATNLLQNFDEAFRRRIGYMLHFPLPDEALRERIWRGIFPKAAPVGELDYQVLARHLELSGASIKNCAVHAAYLAASEGSAITMEHIAAGAKNEYAKLGKTFSPQFIPML